MISKQIIRYQQRICKKYEAAYYASSERLILGISLNVKDHIYPLNGLRIHPEGDTTGWYIWAGRDEPSTDDDFFKPLHVIHLFEWCSEVIPYIGLPPGWRFLITPDYEDVWFDKSLLENNT